MIDKKILLTFTKRFQQTILNEHHKTLLRRRKKLEVIAEQERVNLPQMHASACKCHKQKLHRAGDPCYYHRY